MKWVDFISRILFPPSCLVCGSMIRTGAICEPCLNGIRLNKTLLCARCGARIPEFNKICHRDAAYLLGCAGSYEDPALKLLIHYLKFRGARKAAEPLADLLTRYLADISLDTTKFLLIPLPLSRKRRNERGFNQTEEIARCLAKQLPLQIKNNILVRSRHTKPQTETANAAERERNVIGCFSVSRPDEVARKNIILLDDVTTSGATLGEAARALKAAGARKIIGLTVAKA